MKYIMYLNPDEEHLLCGLPGLKYKSATMNGVYGLESCIDLNTLIRMDYINHVRPADDDEFILYSLCINLILFNGRKI